MVQPKYSPAEALERVKLMMSYDMSKTLNENKKEIGIIEEQNSCPNSITIESAIEKVKDIADSAKKMQTTILRMGYSEERSQEIYQNLKDIYSHNIVDNLDNTCRPGSEVFPEIFKKEHTNWFFGGGNLLTLLKDFTTDYYSDDTNALRYIKASIKILEGGNIKPAPSTTTVTPPKTSKTSKTTPGTNRYTDCTGKGTYKRGCKTSPTGVIGQVQACLGLTQDGRFWDKTQNALISKGFPNGFTDADVTKICAPKQSVKPQTDEFSVQADADDSLSLINT
jgi:hypothetical protein